MTDSKSEVKNLLVVPKDRELYITAISTFWLNEDGILYTTSKNVERKDSDYKEFIALLKRLTKGGNKMCCLTEIAHAMPTDKAMRDYLLAEMPNYIKAMALLSDTPLQATITNITLRLNWNGFPVSQFSTEKEAKAWLKDYL